MGGNAFRQLHPTASFPRMLPAVYQSLRAALLPLVESCYEFVAVPPEAPEKADHGDLDFVVTRPRPGLTHEFVKGTLRATHSIPLEGNRRSHFAIPLGAFPSVARADHAADEFYQVDIGVCADEDEWERTVFLHSYGDFGMILNLLVRGAGLTLNVHGLKLAAPLATQPPVSFHVSASLADILAFCGLARERWAAGFATQRELFEWVATSRLFDARRVPPADRVLGRSAQRREMYQSFLEHARARAGHGAPPAGITQDDALRFFGRDVEHAALLRASRVKQHARETFAGRCVEEWTGMHGLPVKWIMDAARRRLEHEGTAVHSSPTGVLAMPADGKSALSRHEPFAVCAWEAALYDMSVDEVRSLVLEVKGEMERTGEFEALWEKERERKASKQKEAQE